jgi:hypothetical protein
MVKNGMVMSAKKKEKNIINLEKNIASIPLKKIEYF